METNILFIDDDKNILDGYSKLFAPSTDNVLDGVEALLSDDKAGNNSQAATKYNVFTANSGENGVAIVKEQIEKSDPISVIFMDMKMPPGIDGSEAARRIRLFDQKSELVIVTAYSDKNLAEIVRTIGHPDKLLYLKKPFDPAEIQQLALNLSEKYRLERSKELFVSSISHELATPLSSIVGFTELLIDDGNHSEEDQESLNIIKRNSRLLKRLVDDLITVAEISSSPMNLQYKPIDANEFLTFVKMSVTPLFNAKQEVTLQVAELNETFQMNCDNIRIQQAVVNLITNALKFTDKGIIALKAELQDNQFSLSVTDTGIGIPKDKLETVFERFTRIENQHHNQPGLGLGLAITSSIIKAHGGSVKVESVEGEGSTFTLTLPQK